MTLVAFHSDIVYKDRGSAFSVFIPWRGSPDLYGWLSVSTVLPCLTLKYCGTPGFCDSIQALLSAPNPDDPLAEDIARQWKADEPTAIATGE
jgi:hypothetical protein